ncbi:MAG: amidohydrolase family protein [Victivallales bacterium]|nr:amidohydrolase family protein [Victivallales bacterium]
MKIIDFHAHYLPETLGRDEILLRMDAAGIEKSVMLACPDHPRYADSGLTGTNERIVELVGSHPDRFVGGVYIDPRNGMEAQTRARRYRDLGFPLAKMWPAHGFSPDDPAIYPVWEVLNELRMGVLFHSGPLGSGHNKKPPTPLPVIRSAGFNSKFGQPVLIDQPARFFPDIQFIIAHAAYPWTLEALEESYLHRNIHIDFSCPLGFEGINLMERLQPGRIAWDRVLFGTDSAGGGYEKDTKRWLEIAQRPFLAPHAAAFFHDNAAALLKLLSS